MSELTEKIAYLRGLADGMNLDKETNEGKLISEIIDVLGDMGADVDIEADGVDEADAVNKLAAYLSGTEA